MPVYQDYRYLSDLIDALDESVPADVWVSVQSRCFKESGGVWCKHHYFVVVVGRGTDKTMRRWCHLFATQLSQDTRVPSIDGAEQQAEPILDYVYALADDEESYHVIEGAPSGVLNDFDPSELGVRGMLPANWKDVIDHDDEELDE